MSHVHARDLVSEVVSATAYGTPIQVLTLDRVLCPCPSCGPDSAAADRFAVLVEQCLAERGATRAMDAVQREGFENELRSMLPTVLRPRFAEYVQSCQQRARAAEDAAFRLGLAIGRRASEGGAR